METGSDGQFFGRLAVWGCGQEKGAPGPRGDPALVAQGGASCSFRTQAGAVGAAAAGLFVPSAFWRLEWRRFE